MHPAEEREKPKPKPKPQMQGRRVAIIFSNEGKEGNLELWVDPDETVGSVKDQVRLHSSPFSRSPALGWALGRAGEKAGSEPSVAENSI